MIKWNVPKHFYNLIIFLMYMIPIFRSILKLNWRTSIIQKIETEDKKIICEIRWKYSTALCPYCWTKTSKKQEQVLHEQKWTIKHMPYGWDKIIELKLFKRYFRCTQCNKRFFEKFDFESEYWLYTKHFEQYVQWNWWFVSGNKLAELYQSSNSVIHSILERIDVNLLNERWIKIMDELNEIYLGVDEHSFSGHDMVLIITELKSKEVLAILDWVTKAKLEEWINALSLSIQIKIKWFSTDMNKWYAQVLKEIIGNPIQSVDKYHLFQEANKVIDEVRQISIWGLAMNFIKVENIPKLGKKIWKKLTKKDLEKLNQVKGANVIMQKYKAKSECRLQAEQIDRNALINSKGEKVKYNEITADYFIETGYRKLFFYREKNLSPISKLRLNQIFREFDYLGFMAEAWTLKEDFMDAMDNLDLWEIDRIAKECLASEHYRINQFWRTLMKWYAGIKWFCEHSTAFFKFTNALTEWINNLCKVAKRVSHGFRYKSMYIKKLVAKFCLNQLQI